MTSCTDKKNATVLGKMFKRSRTTHRQGYMTPNTYSIRFHAQHISWDYLTCISSKTLNVMNIVIKTIFFIFFIRKVQY